MTTVEFRKDDAATFQSFSAVFINPDYVTDEFKYTTDTHNRGKIIAASWQRWQIRLGLVSEADMDFLQELKKEAAPEMRLNAVTYGVEIERVSTRRSGTNLTIISRAPE